MIEAVLLFVKTFWKPLAIGLAVLVLVVGFGIAKHRYDEAKRDEGRSEIQAKWDVDKAARIKALSDQVALWDQTRQKFEKAAEERDREHELRITEVNALASRLPASVAAVVVPRAAIGVLDAAVHDTGTAARTSSKPVERVSAAAKPASK